jgi:hypothetical protein
MFSERRRLDGCLFTLDFFQKPLKRKFPGKRNFSTIEDPPRRNFVYRKNQRKYSFRNEYFKWKMIIQFLKQLGKTE